MHRISSPKNILNNQFCFFNAHIISTTFGSHFHSFPQVHKRNSRILHDMTSWVCGLPAAIGTHPFPKLHETWLVGWTPSSYTKELGINEGLEFEIGRGLCKFWIWVGAAFKQRIFIALSNLVVCVVEHWHRNFLGRQILDWRCRKSCHSKSLVDLPSLQSFILKHFQSTTRITLRSK